MTSAKSAATFGAHHCHARNCTTSVPPKMFMCYKHWNMIPKSHQRKLWRLYVPGQEITKTPTTEYLNHAMFLVNLVADLESGRK